MIEEDNYHPTAGVSRDFPRWLMPSTRVGAWYRVFKASPYLFRQINYGLRDMPSVPFEKGEILPSVPQTEEDLQFRMSDIESGLREQLYEEVTQAYALEKVN